MSIQYQEGYKYQLVKTTECQMDFITKPFELKKDIVTDFIELHKDGTLVVKSGYAWDGPSGPTFDTKNFMRGSLFHDALYQLMREGHLPHEDFRIRADQLLYDVCVEDGMSVLRAKWVYAAVRTFGHSGAVSNKNILIAP